MLDHGYIGTEHLLLGLIHDGEGVAAKALTALGIDRDAVRDGVKTVIGRGQQPAAGHIPFTPRAKKVLELSLRESTQLGHNYIGTEHILLGLVREGEGVAAQVLVNLGADLNRVRQQVVQLLHGRAGEGASWRARSARTGVIDEVVARLETLDQRLAAIERWVGLAPDSRDIDLETAQVRREKEAAIDAQDFEVAAALRDKEKHLIAAKNRGEKEWEAGAVDRPSMAEDFARLSTELERLRILLRDNGAEPGDGAA